MSVTSGFLCLAAGTVFGLALSQTQVPKKTMNLVSEFTGHASVFVGQTLEYGIVEAAQLRMANIYGQSGNTAKAVEWEQKAAERGNPMAQGNLGMNYYYGRGVPEDKIKGIELLEKAASGGNGDAQFNLHFLKPDAP